MDSFGWQWDLRLVKSTDRSIASKSVPLKGLIEPWPVLSFWSWILMRLVLLYHVLSTGCTQLSTGQKQQGQLSMDCYFQNCVSKDSDFLNRCSHLNKILTNIIARIFLHHIQDFVQFVKGGILAIFHFAMKGTVSLCLMLHHSVTTGNVSTEHFKFWSSCFSTVLRILRELTRPQANAWHHPFLQIRKAAHALAAPQCPTEIEWEERSSWQDLSLGTHEHELQEGLPATWSEK